MTTTHVLGRGYTIVSTTGSVPAQQVAAAFTNLYTHSPAFRAKVVEAVQAGGQVLIQINGADGLPGAKTESVEQTHPVVDQVINIPANAFDGETYGANDTLLALERILAHEMYHAWLNIMDGIDNDYRFDNLTDLEEDQEEDRAVDFENTVRDEQLTNLGLPLEEHRRGHNDWQPGGAPYGPPEPFGPPVPPGLPQPFGPPNPNALPPPKSPLILDLDDDGLELSELGTQGTYFDFDGNGQAELTGWVNSDDGLLAVDSNENGYIDNGLELFGNSEEDGFTVLRSFDSNQDGFITAADDDWEKLVIWRDMNQDGFSQNGELQTLDYYNITSIDLNAFLQENVSIAGHDVTHSSVFATSDGQYHGISDVWFNYNVGITQNVADFEMDDRAIPLPNLRGFGEIKDLFIAVSIDNTGTGNLLDKLENLVASITDPADAFNNWSQYMDDIDALLLQWAGVDGVSPTSRGDHVDARHLEFYEKFFGVPFTQYGQPDPLIEAGAQIENVYDYIKTHAAHQILAQVIGAEIFEDAPVYSLFTGAMSGDMELSQDGIDLIETIAIGSSDPESVWTHFAQFLGYTKGLDNLTVGEIAALDTAVDNTGEPTLDDWADVIARMTATLGVVIEESSDFGSVEVFYDNYINGTSGAETLTGLNNSNDLIEGQGNNDTLYGLSGHDRLDGGSGNDTLDGGVGDDFLIGGNGNDTFIYTTGNDTFLDNSTGTDEIQVAASTGLTSADVQDIYQTGFDLVVQLSTGAFLTIDGHFSSSNKIEQIRFMDDNSTISLTNLPVLSVYGTASNDVLEASSISAGNILYGFGGNDRLEGGDDNDTLYGGTGSDYLNAGEGDDILDGGDGDDELVGESSGDAIGDDTYIASSGRDEIHDRGGEEQIVFGGTIEFGDLTLSRTYRPGEGNSGNVEIKWGENLILISGQFDDNNHEIEELKFFDNSTVDLLALQYTTIGSDAELITDSDFVSFEETLEGITAAGFNHDDIIYSRGGNDWVYGYDGNDYIDGGAGNDRLDGGEGDDIVYGGDGDDSIGDESGENELYGEAGDDRLVGGTGDDVLDGGDDNDSADFSWSLNAVTVSLVAGTATGDGSDTLISIENVFGSLFNDSLTGNANANIIGDDEGDDIVIGNGGNDFFLTGFGNDSFSGGDGVDTISYEYHEGVTVNLTTGTATDGNSDADTLDTIENVIGSYGDDSITGNSLANEISGGQGADNLLGGTGDDTYIFNIEDGEDTITDISGADKITFGEGIALVDLTFTQNGDDLEITFANTLTDKITIINFYDSVSLQTIESLKFADDSTYSLVSLLNGPPVAEDDAFSINEDGTASGNLLDDNGNGMDSDPDTDTLSVEADAFDTAHGSVVIYANGDFEYTPDANYYGTDSFDYTVLDPDSESDIGTVTITINSVNDAPLAKDDSVSAYFLSGNVIGNLLSDNGNGADSDIDGGTLAIVGSSVVSTNGVTVSLSSNGNFTYTPPAEFIGSDTFTYTVSDGQGGTDTAIATITINTPSGMITGTSGNDTLNGTSGDDIIFGFAGNDTINAGDANDVLHGGLGNDNLYGQGGNDTVGYQYSATAVTVSLASMTASGEGTDTLGSIENIIGSEFSDTLTGGSDDNKIYGGAGFDNLYGNDGNDFFVGGSGNDDIYGGNGTDTVSYETSSSGITASLTSNTASGDGNDNFSSIENLTGSAFNDTLTGNSGANVLTGGSGNDTLTGDSGADTLIGGDGDDIFYSGANNDSMSGGAGWDTIYFTGSSAVSIDLRLTTGFSDSHGSTDTITTDFEEIYGTTSSGDTIAGGDTNNIFHGRNGNDWMDGNGGDDILEGGAGNDTMYGGAGTNDTVTYQNAAAGVTVSLTSGTASNDGDGGSDTLGEFENITGSAFADTLTGDSNANILTGLAGNDTLDGKGGNDTINGGDGNDTVSFATGVTVDLSAGTAAGDGNDILINIENVAGSSSADTITGDNNANILTGNNGADALYGGDGDDTLNGGSGDDTLSGGNGNDTAIFGAAITVNLSTGTATGEGTDTLTGIENITGSSSADTITGDGNANILYGGSGNDTITGGDGNDTLNGNDGADTLIGGDGDDIFYSSNNNDSMSGGAGWDTIYFTGSSAVSIDLRLTTGFNDSHGSTDTITTDFEEIYGTTSSGDTIAGGDTNNIFHGRNGNDWMDGNGGDDILEGGAGNDTMYGGAGTNDTVMYQNSAGGVTASLTSGTASNDGDGGSDTLGEFENITGSAFADTLTGDGNANILTGLAGNDALNGGSGTDTLIGGDGADTIHGDNGDDIIYGGLGNDALYGDSGLDTFVFEANGGIDTINDFNVSQDKLDIGDILSGYDPLTDAITDFVQITTSGSNSIVSIDADGGANNFVQIATIIGVTGLTDEGALETSGALVTV